LRQRKDSRAIDPALALQARKSERLRVVKMAPTIELPSAPAADAQQKQDGAKA